MSDMLTDTDVEDHNNQSVRLLEIERSESGSCGFHLTRSKWDPYPWVSGVDVGSAAHNSGLKTGDCILEVNGEDIIGQRITEVAQLVRKNSQVSLLLWNVRIDPQCSPETICCGPMPTNLQRLIACMSSILTFLECPICLDTIPPPAYQCDNGHLICMRCRAKSERCPVCRTRFNRGRSLLADQVYNSITDAFGLKEESYDVRGAKMQQIFKLRGKNKNIPGIKVTQAHSNKLLARLVGKSSSVDNLSTNKSITPTLSLDNEFSTNLKAKSLSSNEIFDVSPIVSRASSINRLNKNASKSNYLNPNKSASCHGSYESLTLKIDLHDLCTSSGGDINQHCPFSLNCTEKIKGTDIIEHFKNIHNGPLIQYFRPNLKLNLENVLRAKDTCCLINYNQHMFILKVLINEPQGDIHLWMWSLGNKTICDNYHLMVKIIKNEDTNTLLSVQSAIHSLNDTSWKDIMESKKGILLSRIIIDSISQINSHLLIDINIVL